MKNNKYEETHRICNGSLGRRCACSVIAFPHGFPEGCRGHYCNDIDRQVDCIPCTSDGYIYSPRLKGLIKVGMRVDIYSPCNDTYYKDAKVSEENEDHFCIPGTSGSFTYSGFVDGDYWIKILTEKEDKMGIFSKGNKAEAKEVWKSKESQKNYEMSKDKWVPIRGEINALRCKIDSVCGHCTEFDDGKSCGACPLRENSMCAGGIYNSILGSLDHAAIKAGKMTAKVLASKPAFMKKEEPIYTLGQKFNSKTDTYLLALVGQVGGERFVGLINTSGQSYYGNPFPANLSEIKLSELPNNIQEAINNGRITPTKN